MSDPPPISHVSTLAPATAVAFLDESFVLSGHARFVNIIPTDDSASATISQKRIFTRERIHGIRVSPDLGKTVFWGGRRIRVCDTKWLLNPAEQASTGEAPLAPDWVLTAILLDDGRVLAVGAHNGLLIFDPKTASWSQTGCGERTMLYSADLAIDHGGITVVGGTVFGEILLWRWREGEASGAVWKRLHGHEGSVFSVRLCDGLVASCSDDRSVRLWDLDQAPNEVDATVNTGMGGEEATVSRTSGNGCVAIGWGHQARPWKVACLPPGENDERTLVTVSEDLTARFWSVPKSTQQQGEAVTMRNPKTFTMHSGKNVWNFDIDAKRNLMVTGGNDGRVCLLDYSDDGDETRAFDLSTVLPTVPDDCEFDRDAPTGDNRKAARPDNWRNYAFVDAEKFVATTEQGRVLLHDLSRSTWELLGRWQGLRNWGHSAAWEGQGLVALGDSKGYLRIFDVYDDPSWSWEADGANGKVDGVFVCPVDGKEKDGDIDTRVFRVLTSSLGPKSLVFHSFSRPPRGALEDPRRQSIHLEPPTPKCIVTSVAYSDHSRSVFIGTRTGDLAIYTLPTEPTTSPLPPTRYIRALSSTDAITSIVPTSTTLTTTSRSGIYSIHSLPSLRALHITKPTPSISQIEGLTTASSSSSPSIYGFRALNFVTHSLALNLDTLTIPCGGAHRSWSFHAPSSSLLWTQSSKLHLFTRKRDRPSQIRVLLPGLHGREIKTAAYNPRYGILATGAEDTTIRLSFPCLSSSEEERVRTGGWRPAGNGLVKHHSTGLMGLAWAPDGKRLVSVGGMEEVFVWRVVVNQEAQEVGVVREAELLPEGEREVRIMDVDVVQEDEKEEDDATLLMAVGTSDGIVRLVRYRPPQGEDEGGKFEFLKEWSYGVICVTQIALHRCGDGGKGIYVIAAATDGCVFAYHHDLTTTESAASSKKPASSSSSPDIPLWRERVHQNTVKALTFIRSSSSSSDNIFRILSGGDDGSISSLRVEVTPSNTKLRTIGLQTVEEAHAGAVIGIELVGERIVTVGSEGRVRVWRGVQKEGVVETVEAGVADPGELVVVGGGEKGNRVAVCGVGVEVWEVA